MGKTALIVLPRIVSLIAVGGDLAILSRAVCLVRTWSFQHYINLKFSKCSFGMHTHVENSVETMEGTEWKVFSRLLHFSLVHDNLGVVIDWCEHLIGAKLAAKNYKPCQVALVCLLLPGSLLHRKLSSWILCFVWFRVSSNNLITLCKQYWMIPGGPLNGEVRLHFKQEQTSETEWDPCIHKFLEEKKGFWWHSNPFPFAEESQCFSSPP